MEDFEKIESYLNDELPDNEKRTFEARLAVDADLRRSVAEFKLLFGIMQKNDAPKESSADLAEKQRLRKIVLAAFDDEAEKGENTEGGKIVPLQPSPRELVKKTRIWWVAAAASVALIVAAGFWFYQKETVQIPQQIAVQTPPPIDTLKKTDVPKSENAVVEAPKGTPQYPKQKEVKKEVLQGNTPQLPSNLVEKTEELETNEPVYAAVETALDRISVETKGNNTDDVIKALRSRNADKAIELSENQMTMDYLKERRGFYLALAYLLKNKKDGIARLKAIEADNAHQFKQNAADLLMKL